MVPLIISPQQFTMPKMFQRAGWGMKAGFLGYLNSTTVMPAPPNWTCSS